MSFLSIVKYTVCTSVTTPAKYVSKTTGYNPGSFGFTIPALVEDFSTTLAIWVEL